MEHTAEEREERELFAGGDPATLEACAAYAVAPLTTPGGRPLADGAAGRLWCAAVEMGGIGAAVRLLRAMDSSAFDTEVAAARRQADNLARAARKDGKVLRSNPYFVRGRRGSGASGPVVLRVLGGRTATG